MEKMGGAGLNECDYSPFDHQSILIKGHFMGRAFSE